MLILNLETDSKIIIVLVCVKLISSIFNKLHGILIFIHNLSNEQNHIFGL